MSDANVVKLLQPTGVGKRFQKAFLSRRGELSSWEGPASNVDRSGTRGTPVDVLVVGIRGNQRGSVLDQWGNI